MIAAPKQKALSSLKMDLQKLFNEWIRERDKDQPCIYCGGKVWWRTGEYQPTAAHFFAVSISEALRYHPNNAHRAHMSCNGENDQAKYRNNLNVRIGFGAVKELEASAHSLVKMTRSEAEELILFYRKELRHEKRNGK